MGSLVSSVARVIARLAQHTCTKGELTPFHSKGFLHDAVGASTYAGPVRAPSYSSQLPCADAGFRGSVRCSARPASRVSPWAEGLSGSAW